VGAPLYVQEMFSQNSVGSGVVKLALVGLLALLLVQSWFYRTATAWNTPAWSLANEAFFYAIFPVALGPLVRGWRRRGLFLVGVIWVIGLVAPVLYLVTNPDGVAATANAGAPWITTLAYSPLTHLPTFVLGMAAGWFHIKRDSAARSPVVLLAL